MHFVFWSRGFMTRFYDVCFSGSILWSRGLRGPSLVGPYTRLCGLGTQNGWRSPRMNTDINIKSRNLLYILDNEFIQRLNYHPGLAVTLPWNSHMVRWWWMDISNFILKKKSRESGHRVPTLSPAWDVNTRAADTDCQSFLWLTDCLLI